MNAAKRGEVWLVDLGMAAKVRPALVIDPGFRIPRAFAELHSRRQWRCRFCVPVHLMRKT